MLLENEGESGIEIKNNTDVFLDGVISLVPNKLSRYNIIKISGEHITLQGNGIIIGDRDFHVGSKGEWGMGVNFYNASNCVLSNLTIKDCWGDCIYIGKKSKNITISKCDLKHSRRQGISITSGNNILISNCTIEDIYGTAPQFGIDIEPNIHKSVRSVILSELQIKNCHGGILCYGKAKNAIIKNIMIKDCHISQCPSIHPLWIKKVSSIVLLNNEIECLKNTKVLFDSVNSIIFKNTTIVSKLENPIVQRNCEMVF